MNLAGQPIAEERDVRADDRAQIQQDRRRTAATAPRGTAAGPSTSRSASAAAQTPPAAVRPPSRSFRPPHLNSPATGLRSARRAAAARRDRLPAAGAAAGGSRAPACGSVAAWRPPASPRPACAPAFCMSMLPRKCAPSAIATRGADKSPSTEPLSRMSTRSVAVMLPCTSPCDDDGLGEDLRLDLAVRSDGQDVLAELDLAFDLSFDRQVLAAAQIAFDDDALADIHDVPLLLRRLRVDARRGRLRWATGGRTRRRGGRRLRRPYGFVTLPHG